ncbi:hypothetical protein ABLO26_02130 [Neobacillus sp. 179-J 1A1 HS]
MDHEAKSELPQLDVSGELAYNQNDFVGPLFMLDRRFSGGLAVKVYEDDG